MLTLFGIMLRIACIVLADFCYFISSLVSSNIVNVAAVFVEDSSEIFAYYSWYNAYYSVKKNWKVTAVVAGYFLLIKYSHYSNLWRYNFIRSFYYIDYIS